ncbi:MAG: hypothetical protein QM621_14670, partial [Aeromicrobium sp.]|uniref:hypothetical protein n=1 Tax=Aeromicrobium sp. TaxID=1871063 RepID=UPI0039E69B33
VHTPDGTTGDWHDMFHWRDGVDRPHQVTLGGSAEVDTNALYGDWGVYEGRDRLVAKGLDVPADVGEVFVADHFRAILDLLCRSLAKYGRVLNLNGATTDWLDTPEQQRLVLEQATRLAEVLDVEGQRALASWIEREYREAA